VPSVRRQVAKSQVLIRSQQNYLKQEERHFWKECTEYVWRSGKLVRGQRNGRSPRSSHFPRKAILNSVQITEHYCSCLPHKQDLSSDHAGEDPCEDRNGNCRRTGVMKTRNGDKRSNHESHKTDAQVETYCEFANFNVHKHTTTDLQ